MFLDVSLCGSLWFASSLYVALCQIVPKKQGLSIGQTGSFYRTNREFV